MNLHELEESVQDCNIAMNTIVTLRWLQNSFLSLQQSTSTVSMNGAISSAREDDQSETLETDETHRITKKTD